MHHTHIYMESKYYFTIIFIICNLYFYNTSSALNFNKDSLLLASIEDYDTNTINKLLDLTKKLSSNQSDSAKFYGKQALLLSKALSFQTGIHKSYVRLAVVDFYQSNYEDALKNIGFVKENITDNYLGKSTLTSALLLEGTIYKSQGDYSKAIMILDSAKNIAKQLGNYHLYALATNNIANIYRKEGRHGTALENYFEVIELIEGKGLNKDEALIFGNIGVLYKEQQDYQKALTYYEKALAVYKKTNDNRSISMVLNNIGNIYFIQKNYQKALETHQSALELRKDINDARGIAASLINIGDVYLEFGEYDKALKMAGESIILNEEIDNKEIELSAKILQTKVFLVKKQYSKTVNNAKSCLTLSVELNDILQQQIAYQLLADAYIAKKDYKNGLFYTEKEQILKDSLFSQSNRRTIDGLTNRFKFEKQERTILNQELAIAQNQVKAKNNRFLLTIILFAFLASTIIGFIYIRNKRNANRNLEKTNADINQQNEALRNTQNNLKVANQDLESFTRMASHDLKEPLRMMGSFAQLLKRKNKHLDDSSKEYIEYISDAAKRMNRMLNDMLAYATQDIVIENTDVFNLNKVVLAVKQDLQFSIDENNASIIVHNELPSIKGQESLILQVFQNLISNAIKYRKPNIKPEINIYSAENDDSIMITIEDNGAGIALKNQERAFKLFQRFNDSKEGSGIGLATCKKIIELHNGSIKLESEIDKGSKFILIFPKR